MHGLTLRKETKIRRQPSDAASSAVGAPILISSHKVNAEPVLITLPSPIDRGVTHPLADVIEPLIPGKHEIREPLSPSVESRVSSEMMPYRLDGYWRRFGGRNQRCR